MKVKPKTFLPGWLIHFFGVIAFINLAYIVRYFTDWSYSRQTPYDFFVKHSFHDTDSLITLIGLFFIEINYCFLFKKLRLSLFILSSLAVGILVFAVQYCVHFDKYINFHTYLTPIFIVSAYAFTYAIVRNYLYQLRYKKDIQLQQSKNELNALKAQLNPHFLFNSLNYLYGTALSEKATLTADGIDKLASMMRYTITGIHENFVPVENEIAFITDYLSLQQARLPKSDRISIDINLSTPPPGKLIAPLLMLPFIENAFKYGISMDEPCFVTIRIVFTETGLICWSPTASLQHPLMPKETTQGSRIQ